MWSGALREQLVQQQRNRRLGKVQQEQAQWEQYKASARPFSAPARNTSNFDSFKKSEVLYGRRTHGLAADAESVRAMLLHPAAAPC